MGVERGGRLAAGVAVALALAACSSGSNGGGAATTAAPTPTYTLNAKAVLAKQSIVVSNWPHYMSPTVAADFTKATKAKAKVVTHATNEEVVDAIIAGTAKIDVAFVSGQYAQQLNELGLLEPIDPRLVPNLAKTYPEARDLAFDPGSTFSAPYSWGTTGICYRADLVGKAPDSWEQLVKPTGPNEGKVLMMSLQPWLNVPAARMLDFSVSTTDSGELDDIEKTLVKARPSWQGLDDTGFVGKLDAGTATMAESFDAWCNYATNRQVKFVLPKEGSDVHADVMVVLKSSKSKEAAMAFLNFMLAEPQQYWLTDNVLAHAVNRKVGDITAKTLGKDYGSLTITPAVLGKQGAIVYLGEKATARYAEIAAAVRAAG